MIHKLWSIHANRILRTGLKHTIQQLFDASGTIVIKKVFDPSRVYRKMQMVTELENTTKYPFQHFRSYYTRPVNNHPVNRMLSGLVLRPLFHLLSLKMHYMYYLAAWSLELDNLYFRSVIF